VIDPWDVMCVRGINLERMTPLEVSRRERRWRIRVGKQRRGRRGEANGRRRRGSWSPPIVLFARPGVVIHHRDLDVRVVQIIEVFGGAIPN